MRQWRFIYDQPASGSRNMAIDEALWYGVAQAAQAPTVRVYAWEPHCLSLGYGQRMRDVDMDALTTRGWGLVRRPTGGKAILHGDELTYSISLPIDHPLAQGDVVESYRRISEALLCALQGLGLQPQSEQHAKGNHGLGPVCFEVPSHYEITVGGRKLIGSAQLRRSAGILQHGTLPLTGDIARICDVLVYDDDHARATTQTQVRERATTLEQVLNQPVAYETAAEALWNGFEQAFGITFRHETLSDAELSMAHDLETSLYGTVAYTHKR